MLDTLEIRMVEIQRQVADLAANVAALETEIGGAPKLFLRGDRRNIRDRLHELENDREAVKIAQAALRAAEATRRHSWSVWEKVALFALAVAGAAGSLAKLFAG